MIGEKEKAQLAVQVIEKFAPYMDHSTEQFHIMGLMITQFGSLVESFADLPEEKKKEFMSFIKVFNEYIETASNNQAQLRDFYSFMTQTTNTLIAEFKIAIGIAD